MTLNVCVHCTTRFSIGVAHCPQCGNADFHEEGSMPKISRHGGATYVGERGPELLDYTLMPESESSPTTATPFVVEVSPVEVIEDDGPDDAPNGPYAGMLRADLQALCGERGLPTSGSKADLIARLTAADEAAPDGSEPF